MTTNVSRFGQVNEQFGVWALTSSYRAGDMVIYNSNIYIANGAIPANTAFTVGTTGATWSLQLVNAKPAGGIAQVSTGYGSNTFLVRTTTGKIYSCSSSTNAENWPGTGRRTDATTPSPVGVSSMSEVVFIDLADRLTNALFEETGTATFMGIQGRSAYVLFSTGNLWAWGDNSNGQLGLGNTTNFSTPKRVAANVAEVYISGTRNDGNSGCGRSTGSTRLVYRGTDNKVYGCGYNGQGGLGLGNLTNPITTPTELTWAGTSPYSVWNLGDFNGGIIVNRNVGGGFGQIWVAGANGNGCMGTGGTLSTPVDVTLAWTGVATNNTFRINQAVGNFGDSDNGSTSNNNSTLMMWLTRTDDPAVNRLMTCGYGINGQIGSGTNSSTTTPYRVSLGGSNNPSLKQINVLSRGSMYALLTTGQLYSWGYNGFGQLGLGTTTDTNSPTTTTTSVGSRGIGLDNIKEILFTGQGSQFLARQSTLVLRKNSSDLVAPNYYVACGYNGGYMLADGTNTDLWLPRVMGYPPSMNWAHCGTWTQSTTTASQCAVLVDDTGGMWMTTSAVAYETNYNAQLNYPIGRPVRVNPAVL